MTPRASSMREKRRIHEGDLVPNSVPMTCFGKILRDYRVIKVKSFLKGEVTCPIIDSH